MERVSWRVAVDYALSREMIALYGVVLLGYVFLSLGTYFGAEWAFRGGGAGAIGRLLATLFVAGGIVVVYVGGIALIYKVIADATSE